MSCCRDAQIYAESEPAKYFYKVVSGGVRTFKVLIDGRRQVAGFYLENETFGVEADGDHGFSAEAIVDTKFIATKRSLIEVLASEDEQIARELRGLLGGELKRARDHALLLVKRAPERLASFLVSLLDRIQTRDEVELPMSRRDIADHLGLTIETVSRTLAILESLSAIDLQETRRIIVRDRAILHRLGE